MIFTSAADLYFLSLGFYAYNVIWSIVVQTGLVYLPFIIVIVGTIRDGAESTKNFADSGFMLKRLETKVYPMLIAVALCAAPITDFDVSETAQFTKICEADSSKRFLEQKFDESPDVIESERLTDNVELPSKSALIELSGKKIELPVLLKFVLVYSTGFVVEAIDNLPCGVNISALSDQFSNMNIADHGLKVEYREFVRQCFEPAKKKALKRPADTNMPWIAQPNTEDQPWPGHEAFMNSTYYGNVGEDFYSKSLIPGFQGAKTNQFVSKWVESKNAELSGADCSGDNCLHKQGGFPSCYEWWAGVGAGYPGVSISSEDVSLKERLWQNLSADRKAANMMGSAIAKFSPWLSKSELDSKLFMMAYHNPNIMQQLQDAETKDYAFNNQNVVMGAVSRVLGTVGVAMDVIPSYAGASMIQLAAPLAKAAALFVLISCLPLALVIAKFDWKFIVPLHFFVGSILFWPFLWELAILAQQSFIEQVMEQGDIGLVDFIKDPNIKMLSQSLTDNLFLIFPSLWTAVLTASGMSVGSALSSFASSPGGEAGSPGKGGGKKIQGMVESKIESKVNPKKKNKRGGNP